MARALMTNAYQQAQQSAGPLAWPLAPRQAVTLAADAAPRALWVHEGRVWLTRQGAPHSPEAALPEDVWLDAGQSHALPAGTEWVAEAWPQACVSVVQAPALLKRGVASSSPISSPSAPRSASPSSWLRPWPAVPWRRPRRRA